MLAPVRGAPTSSRVCVCAVYTEDVRQRIDRYRDTSVSRFFAVVAFERTVFVAETVIKGTDGGGGGGGGRRRTAAAGRYCASGARGGARKKRERGRPGESNDRDDDGRANK